MNISFVALQHLCSLYDQELELSSLFCALHKNIFHQGISSEDFFLTGYCDHYVAVQNKIETFG